MKMLSVILVGILIQLASLESPAAAHQTRDNFCGRQHHFDMVVQTECWDAVNNQNDPESYKKIPRPDFSIFGGKISSPAHSYATGYSSRTKKVVRPLRYQLCVLRL